MRALSVFSGGLDSILASALILDQGIDVQGLFFETPFFSADTARQSALTIGLPLKIIDITSRHLPMLRTPKHGYGGNMNPCIDCHALMFRIAGEVLEKEDAHFIITGEVLGQRPMSQNKQALSLVESESGLSGLLVRPLSAKNLPLSLPEKKGWVNRDKLMGFSGRSRKPQLELAQQLHIDHFPAPAGGCLLTDIVFAKRLKDLFSSQPEHEIREIELLKVGRHFRIGPNTKVIVGRNQIENESIQNLARHDDLLFWTITVPGPTVLVMGKILPDTIQLAVEMTAAYSDGRGTERISIGMMKDQSEYQLESQGVDKKEFRRYMIC